MQPTPDNVKNCCCSSVSPAHLDDEVSERCCISRRGNAWTCSLDIVLLLCSSARTLTIRRQLFACGGVLSSILFSAGSDAGGCVSCVTLWQVRAFAQFSPSMAQRHLLRRFRRYPSAANELREAANSTQRENHGWPQRVLAGSLFLKMTGAARVCSNMCNRVRVVVALSKYRIV